MAKIYFSPQERKEKNTKLIKVCYQSGSLSIKIKIKGKGQKRKPAERWHVFKYISVLSAEV